MKQAILKFPKEKTPEVAKFFAEQGIVTNISYLEAGDGFFSTTSVVVVCCFPEDKQALFQAQFQNYIKTKI